MKIGLDIGSTTIKCVVLDESDNIIYKTYDRHFSEIAKKTPKILKYINDNILKGEKASLVISGSAGMGLAGGCNIPFMQEVYSTRAAVKRLMPESDVVIELGGEDAKILFVKGITEVRMNGSCAGGTGAFIDQMATLLKVTPKEMNIIAKEHKKTYTIASRCGVFAKSDIQPLINQGAHREDIAKSIFDAVANQTIAGLAQGRKIQGNILYLGGPLTFFEELRNSFDKFLNCKGICPENSLYYVSYGCAVNGDKEFDLNDVIKTLENYSSKPVTSINPPLFKTQKEYEEFQARHKKAKVSKGEFKGKDDVYIGVDAGSTTIKMTVVNKEKELLFSKYRTNSGNPVPLVKDFLLELYDKHPDINILGSTVTGYGEELIKNAFGMDFGIVETIAHFTAAKEFLPQVEFVLDIGGQDIKCFKIRNGVIENIYLNEACSSGCGSFLQTFANALGYDIEEFSKLGIFADSPVELGSRCTVFMNSSVKQVQKDGASIENISAGLSMSVVKNALYKVIRVSSKEELGKHIVVQGGTFYNDAVLRTFEKELDCNAVRPDISGIMGAFGAALYSKEMSKQKSSILTKDELLNFSYTEKTINCGLCSNHCQLTVNTFNNGKKYISGNKCEKPLKNGKSADDLNIYKYKRSLLEKYFETLKENEKVIGIPMGLNNYELLPFWHRFFKELGYTAVSSGFSDRATYIKGQMTIPSDTVCYPAKLIHGHIEILKEKGIKTIFYPCMSYNINENKGDNHFNCPVVAYYPEVIKANCQLDGINFISDYISIDNKKKFALKIQKILSERLEEFSLNQIKKAVDAAFDELYSYKAKIIAEGETIIKKAREKNLEIIVLSGRPYHIDPEISHGIDTLITSLGAAVICEDCISHLAPKFNTHVLNQWTYHARMYSAAKYIENQNDMELIQLVSFGCGVDAITTDEVRDILEKENKIYTQIKIDEITNLGAVKIRLRSLFAAINQRKRNKKV